MDFMDEWRDLSRWYLWMPWLFLPMDGPPDPPAP